jgi:hypothetical protein
VSQAQAQAGGGGSDLSSGGRAGNAVMMPVQPLECTWEVEPPQVAAMTQVVRFVMDKQCLPSRVGGY